MGYDLAVKVLVTPDVAPVSVRQFPDALARRFPKVFAAFSVTRAMYKWSKDGSTGPYPFALVL